MKRLAGFSTATLLAFAATACGDGEERRSDGASAQGEILPRSVGDDMLPYDRVRSQPPLAVPEPTGDATGAAQAGGSQPSPSPGESGGGEGEAAQSGEPAQAAPASPAPPAE